MINIETFKFAIELAAPAVAQLLASPASKSNAVEVIVNAYHAVAAAQEQIKTSPLSKPGA